MALINTKNIDSDEFSKIIRKHKGTDDKRDEIKNVKISSFSLTEKTINNKHFINTSWENINAENIVFENVTFENCEIKNTNLKKSTLNNVTFKNCILENIILNKSKFKNLNFMKSKLLSNDPNITNSYRLINGDSVSFTDTEITNINFFDSKAKFSFINCKLNDVSGIGLMSGSSLIIKNSNAVDIDFSSSNLNTLEIANSTIKESKINDSSINKVILENNIFERFPIASNKTYNEIYAKNSSELTIHGTGPVNNVQISNCQIRKDLYISEMEFNMVDINNCNFAKFISFEVKGNKMIISNIEANSLDLEEAHIAHLILRNVTIHNKIYMDNAKIEKYESSNVKLGNNIIIKDKGASFKITNAD